MENKTTKQMQGDNLQNARIVADQLADEIKQAMQAKARFAESLI